MTVWVCANADAVFGGIECFHEECKMRSSGALLLY